MQWKMLLVKAPEPLALSDKVLARYKNLIGGAIYQHRRNIVNSMMTPGERSLRRCGKWAILARRIVKKDS
jgi:hypothetical protein